MPTATLIGFQAPPFACAGKQCPSQCLLVGFTWHPFRKRFHGPLLPGVVALRVFHEAGNQEVVASGACTLDKRLPRRAST